MVVTNSQLAGRMVTQAKRPFFILKSTTVPRINAIAASIWLPMPNSGHSELMPPSGSVTPC